MIDNTCCIILKVNSIFTKFVPLEKQTYGKNYDVTINCLQCIELLVILINFDLYFLSSLIFFQYFFLSQFTWIVNW